MQWCGNKLDSVLNKWNLCCLKHWADKRLLYFCVFFKSRQNVDKIKNTCSLDRDAARGLSHSMKDIPREHLGGKRTLGKGGQLTDLSLSKKCVRLHPISVTTQFAVIWGDGLQLVIDEVGLEQSGCVVPMLGKYQSRPHYVFSFNSRHFNSQRWPHMGIFPFTSL